MDNMQRVIAWEAVEKSRLSTNDSRPFSYDGIAVENNFASQVDVSESPHIAVLKTMLRETEKEDEHLQKLALAVLLGRWRPRAIMPMDASKWLAVSVGAGFDYTTEALSFESFMTASPPESEHPLHSETLAELRGLDTEALESDYDPCDKTAKTNAEDILKCLNKSPRHCGTYYMVSPTPDGEVDIELRTKDQEGGLSILCSADGDATCMVSWMTHKDRDVMFKCENAQRSLRAFCNSVLDQLDNLREYDDNLNRHE